MDATLIDEHLELAQHRFRSILRHCKDLDSEQLRRKLFRHNAEMLNIAGSMFPQHPTPSSSPHDHRSRARERDSQYTPSASSSRSSSPIPPSRTRKREQDDPSPKKRRLLSRRELRGEAVPAQMTAEPVDKPNGGRARSFRSNAIIKPNIFGKVNAKLSATKPVVEIPAKKHTATIDLTGLEDSDDELAGSEPEPEQVRRGNTVGEISKNFLDLQRAVEASLNSHRATEEESLDLQRAVEESLFVERDCNGLTRAEKEKLRMSDGRDGDDFGGPMRELSEVDDEILAGFEAGREGEWSDHEMEMGMMYDDEEGGVAHEDEDEGGEMMHEGEKKCGEATDDNEAEEESGKVMDKGKNRDDGQGERLSKRSRSL